MAPAELHEEDRPAVVLVREVVRVKALTEALAKMAGAVKASMVA